MQKIIMKHTTRPLPSTFTPTSEDCSESVKKGVVSADEYKLDYASCIGSLMYLSETRLEISFIVDT
jgi:hypothetical protein